jgi:hypothetical protein
MLQCNVKYGRKTAVVQAIARWGASLGFVQAEITRPHPFAHSMVNASSTARATAVQVVDPRFLGRPVHRLAEVARRLHDDLERHWIQPSTGATMPACRCRARASARCGLRPELAVCRR